MENKVVSKKEMWQLNWALLIAFAIIGFHTLLDHCDELRRQPWLLDAKEQLVFGSSEVLLIFTVTAGYFHGGTLSEKKG